MTKLPHSITSTCHVSEQRIVKNLLRARQSLMNHNKRGGSLNSIRGQQLADRYDALRSQAQQHQHLWQEYCIAIDADSGHRGFDYFA